MHIELIHNYRNLTPVLNYLDQCKIQFSNDVEKLGLATLIDGYSRHIGINKIDLETSYSNRITELFNYFINGKKIDFIKEIRSRTGKGLGESKKIADDIFQYIGALPDLDSDVVHYNINKHPVDNPYDEEDPSESIHPMF